MSRTFSIQGRLRQLVAGISFLLVVVMLSALALLLPLLPKLPLPKLPLLKLPLKLLN